MTQPFSARVESPLPSAGALAQRYMVLDVRFQHDPAEPQETSVRC